MFERRGGSHCIYLFECTADPTRFWYAVRTPLVAIYVRGVSASICLPFLRSKLVRAWGLHMTASSSLLVSTSIRSEL